MTNTITVRLFALALLCLAAASCASPASGPAFKPEATAPGQGVIYVYSLNYPYGKSNIEVDGKHVATMQHKGHVAIQVPAGKHEVRSYKGCIPLCAIYDIGRTRQVDVPKGGAVYMRIDVVFVGIFGGVPQYQEKFSRVSNEVGEAQIRQTKRSKSL